MRRSATNAIAQFNSILDDIIDKLIQMDNQRIFFGKVKKKVAPDYYDIIK